MVIVGKVVITDEVLNAWFACDLAACGGRCCSSGNAGAPLEPAESAALEEHRPGGILVEADGTRCTAVGHDGACVFCVSREGILRCSIEEAWSRGELSARKPVSCHLYPIRVVRKPPFDVLTLDVWDICANAADKGLRERMPLIRFCGDALARKYGVDFLTEALRHAESRLKRRG